MSWNGVFTKRSNILEDQLQNVLISYVYRNIDRPNPNKIVDYDPENFEIRINLKDLKPLTVSVDHDKGWFLTQPQDSREYISYNRSRCSFRMNLPRS